MLRLKCNNLANAPLPRGKGLWTWPRSFSVSAHPVGRQEIAGSCFRLVSCLQSRWLDPLPEPSCYVLRFCHVHASQPCSSHHVGRDILLVYARLSHGIQLVSSFLPPWQGMQSMPPQPKQLKWARRTPKHRSPSPLGLSPNARMRSPSQIGPSPWGESRVLLVSSQEWSLQLSNWNFRPSSSHAKPLFFTPTFVITKRNVHHAVTITKRGMCCIRSLGM